MSFDVGIIGGGVSGCATALALAKSGARVFIAERVALGQESSWAGGGILFPLLPWDYSEAVNSLVLRSIALFPDWVADIKLSSGIDPELQQSGMLVLPPFDTSLAKTWCNAHATALIDTPASSLILDLPQDQPALWLRDVYQVRNPRLLKALKNTLNKAGITIFEQAEVSKMESQGARIKQIHTSRGILQADRYLVASGAWSKQLLGEHALKLDIRPIRGQMLLFKTDPGALRAIILKDGIYLIPRLDGYILVGSTLEDAGFDKSTTEEARSMLHAQATSILPLLKTAPLVQHWSGLRPGSPDNIPTIDRHPELENLYINSGHFRYGVTMAPASAEIMANLIFNRPQAIDIAPYGWPCNRN